MKFKLSKGQLKVISSVLSNLAAAWLASVIIVPGLFGVKSLTEAVFLLTYSLLFATLAIYLTSKIEDDLL